MRTYYVFQAASSPDLRGYTYDPAGERLPAEYGPWTPVQQIGPDDEWTQDVSRAVVAGGILDDGYYLWGPVDQPGSSKPIIESDRVEGTAVYNRDNHQIGTIQRLLIEKVSGRVLYVDVTFGGFMGMGVHHLTIPWECWPTTQSLKAITRTSRKSRSEALRPSTVRAEPGLVPSEKSN